MPIATLAVLLVGCGSTPRLLLPAPPRAVDAATAAPALPAGANIVPTEIARGESSSLAIVQIRDRETPHAHGRYDLTVTLLDGEGVLWLEGVALPMRTGDVAFVPRGTPHHFVNGGDTPARAAVVFAPAFTGPDQEPIP